MIAYIKGEVVLRQKDHIVLEAQGIGYKILCGNPLLFPVGEKCTVYTYQHVREDDISLFGFLSREEKEIFELLISVKGVGPKTGAAIMGFSGASRLSAAIEAEDINFLCSLPGIGRKTASQIILDLRGKLIASDIDTLKASAAHRDAIEALLALGFKRNEINQIKQELLKDESEDLNMLVKRGLQLLNKDRG